MSKTFVLRRQGSSTKEVSEIQQVCLASRETEAVELDLGMSTALSMGPLADRHGPSQGEARFSNHCLAGKTEHVDVVMIVCSK
jgi:hypothetical protein